MNKEVKWLLNDRIFENTKYENLDKLIENLGYECKVIKDHGFNIQNPGMELFPIDDCVITYTTINIARKIPNYFGKYLNEHNLKYHVYSSLYSANINEYLNGSNAQLTTYKHFKQDYSKYFNYHDEIFIRPDSGIKLFSGFVLNKHQVEYNIQYLNTTSLNDESLIWISPKKEFTDETRFIIAGNEVIDGSRYSLGTIHSEFHENFIEDKNYPEVLWEYAEKLALSSWSPDPVYTLDLCMTGSGPKIVEINSFACAGLYACDVELIIKKVSEYTLNLYKEQFG